MGVHLVEISDHVPPFSFPPDGHFIPKEDVVKKSTNVAVTAVAAISLSIACNSRTQDSAARVCVDGAQRVVSADMCYQPHGYVGAPYFWYYHGAYTGGYPPHGTAVRAGGTAMPAGAAAPTARGGFGATASGRAVGA